MRFTRVTLFFIAFIIALGFYQLGSHMQSEVEPQTFQATEESMVDAAHLFAELAAPRLKTETFDREEFDRIFQNARQRKFEARIFDHVKNSVGLNLYLTNAAGLVLYDSQNGHREGLDYSRMRDVSLTLRGKYGARASRDSPEGDELSILYVAAPIGDPASPAGVLTVFKPKRDMLPILHARKRIIYTACALIGGGIAFLIGAVFLWLFRPIGRITDYARAIERGERPAKPKIGIGREVNTLAHALDSMRDALENRNYVESYIQTLTHELKSPLAGIRGAAELLMEDMEPAARVRFLENILSETSRSERLIHRLLELSSIEARKTLDGTETVDLETLIREVIDQLQPTADLTGIRIESSTKATSPLVLGDRWILRCALVNLLENAIDFSPPGSTISVHLQDQGDQLMVEVIDEGGGLPDYAVDRAFERFFSLRHPSTRRKGTGLGLTLVREAAELHGGSASLQNRDTKGAVARLTLPAHRIS